MTKAICSHLPNGGDDSQIASPKLPGSVSIPNQDILVAIIHSQHYSNSFQLWKRD
jgi:hypothetical protein